MNSTNKIITIFESFEESLDVLRTNRLRTFLSALGIIIGIGSVIALLTLGEGSKQSVREQIQSLGANLLTIRAGSQTQGFLRGAPSTATTLKNTDYEAIRTTTRITTLKDVAAEYSGRVQVSYGRNNTNSQITGVTENMFGMKNIGLEYGNLFTEQDRLRYAKVAVIGQTVATDLFGEGVNPVGESISIKGTSYTVIGLTESKGGFGTQSTDEQIYVPLETAQKVLFGVDYLSNIYAEAKSEQDMEGAKNQLGFLLLELHKKQLPADADFSITSQEDILDTITSVTGTFTTLLAGVAAISLVVGGIGVMNIMLVTVTERTSEIGLRKALGAKKKSIIKQFLYESLILTIGGGIIGVLVGIAVSVGLTKALSLPLVIPINGVILSFFVSATVGIIFGLYPAYKAARLQPVEALRFE